MAILPFLLTISKGINKQRNNNRKTNKFLMILILKHQKAKDNQRKPMNFQCNQHPEKQGKSFPGASLAPLCSHGLSWASSGFPGVSCEHTIDISRSTKAYQDPPYGACPQLDEIPGTMINTVRILLAS